MKIQFILPDINSVHKLNIHFGIAYISGFLKSNGYKDIRFATVTDINDYNNIITEVVSFQPDIVAFTSVETQFYNVINLSKLIKEVWKCVIVCGGTFPTIYPDCIKDAECLDGIFIGEGEKAFLKFVRAVDKGRDYSTVENFYFYEENKRLIVKNPLLPLETNLDNIGFPDYEIFGFQNIINSYGGIAPFVFNRGCPYNCSFCSNHALASVYGKVSNSTRRRSVDSCIAEIKLLCAKYRFDIVLILDDLFITDRKWLYRFLDSYRLEIKKSFNCTARSNLCDDDLFRKLKKAGCYQVHMSLESGNDFIRNKVMKRNVSRDKIIESVHLAKKYGIKVTATTIIGLPFETEDMINDTISFLGLLKVENLGVNVFYPYKGTQLRKVCEEYGMICPDISYDCKERRESILNLPHISKEKLQYYFENFDGLVRREEGLLSYIRWRIDREAKGIAKKIFPEKVKQKIREARLKRILVE